MNEKIEEAIEYVKESSLHNNDIYAQEALDIIKQDFINLEIEYNKMKRRAGSHKESAIKFNTKLNKIRAVVGNFVNNTNGKYCIDKILQILNEDR